MLRVILVLIATQATGEPFTVHYEMPSIEACAAAVQSRLTDMQDVAKEFYYLGASCVIMYDADKKASN